MSNSMIDDGTIELVSPTMKLVEQFYEALTESYSEHARFLKWAKPNPGVSETASNMADAISRYYRREGELRFIILRKTDSRVVGCIGLILRNLDIPYLEIGYWARSSEAGNGYISRAVSLVELFAVSEFNVKRLEIKMATTNYASRRVAQKSGFTHEATHELDRILPTGEIVGTHVYCKTYS